MFIHYHHCNTHTTMQLLTKASKCVPNALFSTNPIHTRQSLKRNKNANVLETTRAITAAAVTTTTRYNIDNVHTVMMYGCMFTFKLTSCLCFLRPINHDGYDWSNSIGKKPASH